MFEHLVATLQTLPVPYYETDYLYRQMVNLLLTMTTASVLSRVRLFMTPWALAHQTPPSMELSRQEYWSRFHFLFQGIFLTQGSNPNLLRWQMHSLALCHLGSPLITIAHALFRFLLFLSNLTFLLRDPI